MAFDFERSSCVAVGTFNMHIIHPEWLVKIGVVKEGTEFGFEVNLSEPGHRFSLKNGDACRWVVSPSRVTVETEDPTFDCGKQIAKMLEKLSWTPLAALGSNNVYSANISEIELLPQWVIGGHLASAPETLTIKQSGWHTSLSEGHSSFNLQISFLDDEMKLQGNVHTELRGQDNAVNLAQEAAKAALKDRQHVEKLFSELIGVTFNHGYSND